MSLWAPSPKVNHRSHLTNRAKGWTRTTTHFSKVLGSDNPDNPGRMKALSHDKVLKGCKEVVRMPLILEMELRNDRPKKGPIWSCVHMVYQTIPSKFCDILSCPSLLPRAQQEGLITWEILDAGQG